VEGRNIDNGESAEPGAAADISARSAAAPPDTSAPYQGNQVDLTALIGALLGGIVLAGCSGLTGCLPLVAALLGGYAYANAERSHDPRRTRLLAGLGLAASALLLLVLLGFIAFFMSSVFIAILSAGGH
jgi:hypothetical protein